MPTNISTRNSASPSKRLQVHFARASHPGRCCQFISEALIMRREQETISRAAIYATANEKDLWKELKGELCTTSLRNWLFNAAVSKKRPGDLGYRIGYKIAESFYINAADKKAAIREMVETDNPLVFLDKSKYDLKFR